MWQQIGIQSYSRMTDRPTQVTGITACATLAVKCALGIGRRRCTPPSLVRKAASGFPPCRAELKAVGTTELSA